MQIWKNLRITLLAVGLLWLVHLLNLFLPIDFRHYGLRPRQAEGLWGIFLSPFLHANTTHLLANSGALLFLLTVSLSLNRKLTVTALWMVLLIGGGLVWLLGAGNSIHIGASGVIFGLIGFLLFAGVFRREWKALLCSIIVFFLYGGALLSLLAPVPGISWSGHLFGFLAGAIAAWATRTL
ncbi:rhomboid family intramembrane serine protease [Thermodesulfobacteriota bacterium]